MRMETSAIHVGQKPDPSTGAVITPVYQTSTYEQEGIGTPRGHAYSRAGNPTREALESVLASLEGGKSGLAFASGVAARMTHSVFTEEERAKIGIRDNLVRLSVGIEHRDDLKEDLEQALKS